MSIYRRRLMIAAAQRKSDGNINYPGLIAAWSAKGKSNDDADRAVLHDLTGNGHDLTLNNFAFREMSGYGGYRTKLNGKAYLDHDTYNFEVTETSIKIENFTGTLNLERISSYWTWNEYKIKVIGLNANEYLRIYYCLGSSSLGWNYTEIRNDGIYTVPQSTMSDSPYNRAPFIKGNFKNIAIQLLPEYPDALVFDGVDDYGVTQVGTIDELTCIMVREYTNYSYKGSSLPFGISLQNSNNASFNILGFERAPNSTDYPNNAIILFGTSNLLDSPASVEKNIVYVNSTTYNGISISKGSLKSQNLNDVTIGKVRVANNALCARIVFYSAYLFDRSLDEQEIKSFIRKYIDADYVLPSEQATE